MTPTELLIPPSHVDWRLYDHEVQMGWKTSEQIQHQCDSELAALAHTGVPGSIVRKYLGLSKLPGLVEVLTEDLKADRTKKVVLFFETRDVGMALRESLKPYKPILLFKGTPDSQRAKRLKDFTKPWSRVAVVAHTGLTSVIEATESWFVELSATPLENLHGWNRLLGFPPTRLVLLAGTVDEALMRSRWAATEKLLEGVTV